MKVDKVSLWRLGEDYVQYIAFLNPETFKEEEKKDVLDIAAKESKDISDYTFFAIVEETEELKAGFFTQYIKGNYATQKTKNDRDVMMVKTSVFKTLVWNPHLSTTKIRFVAKMSDADIKTCIAMINGKRTKGIGKIFNH